MTRRVHAERSNCELTRAKYRTANVLNADEDEIWQRRKRNARNAFQSDESAESHVDERALKNGEQKKQRAYLKSRRHYNENDDSLLDVKDCATIQSKKQHKKMFAKEKCCVQTERNYRRAKRQRYAVSSGDSETATLNVTETSDASTSSSNSSRYKMGAKYKSYDDIACNSERVNYAKCKRHVSDDCVPPERLACVQKYAPEPTPNKRTSSKSANEMLQFVSNLFKQLSNTNNAMAVNTATNVGVHGDVSSKRGTKMFDNAVNQHGTPLKSTLQQFAVGGAFGGQLSGEEIDNPTICKDPTGEEFSNVYSTEARQAHNQTVPHSCTQPGAPNCATTKLRVTAGPSYYGNNKLQQKNAFQNYYTKTQAEYAPTSRAHVVTASATTPQQQQPYAPRAYVAANLTPTVQPVQFAATKLGAHVVPANNYTNYTQAQGNMTPQSGVPAAMQFNSRGAYGQETLSGFPATPVQSLEYVNRFQSKPRAFVLSRAPIMPQIASTTTDENLVRVTYITPQPTEVPIAEENQDTVEFNNARTLSSNLLRTTSLRSTQQYPTSFIYTGSNARLLSSNLIEHTNDTAAATSFAPKVHPTADVRQADTQTSNLSEKVDVIASSHSDTHLFAGKIIRPNIRAQAVDQILLPIIETQLEQTVYERRNSTDRRSSVDTRNSAEARRGETNGNAVNRRNSQNITSKRESMDRAESNKKDEARPNRSKGLSKGKIVVRSEENSDEEGASSSCNSDYIRECLRKRRHKKKFKEAERNRTHRKQGKHYQGKYLNESDSKESSDDLDERGSRYSRSRSKRHKRYEPYTPNRSESDDEMEDSFSKTSCKQIKKCCSRIVAICRKARDTAGTQTDECCDCAPKPPKTTSQAQCSCKCEKDKQRQFCESLANADQNALRKTMQLNREKKKCKVYACGAAGKNGAPQLQDDMIIIKFEEDEDAKSSERAQQQSAESATHCKNEGNCKATESEAEMIKALIRKKRVYDKIKKACSLTSVKSERCTCADQADEAEFMADLLSQKRLERTMKNNCACDMDDKAREMATAVMKRLIVNHIRSMCAAELANKAASSTSESFAKCLCGLESETANCKQQFAAQKEVLTNSSCASCAACLCGLESESKIVRKQLTTRTASSSNESCAECLCGRAPKILPGDCTCNRNPYERKRSNTERKLDTYNRNEANTCANDYACSVDKNEYRSTKPQLPTRARSPSSSSKVSAKESDKLSARDACCTCNERKNEKGTTKVKPDRAQRVLEIEITAGAERRTLVRNDKNNAYTNNCTCESSSESESAQRKPKRAQRSHYSDDSEMSVPTGDCTCKPSNQIRGQSVKTLNMSKSGNAVLREQRDARENKSKARRMLSKTPAPKRDDFSRYEAQTCRTDCACKGAKKYKNARSQENLSESMSDYEEHSTARKPTAPSAKVSRDLGTRRRHKEFTKTCEPDCACKQTFGQRELTNSADHIEERIVARRKNMVEQSSEDDESLYESNEQKSVQKLTIGIKASKEARASCTVITYPQSIKTIQRSKRLADAEQSAISNARDRQAAALCAELALNDLLPQYSLRTLLTKLSSPNGKLLCSKDLESSSVPDHDINTFLMDQSKVLSLKTGRNGQIKPTMIMSQAIRVTGNKSNATQKGALEPLHYYRKKVLKLSSSAPSLVLTTDYAYNSRSNAAQAKPETTSSKQKLKKSLIPLAARSHGGKHLSASKAPTLTQSESAETRANTRPYINHTGESNSHITRLWPEQQRQQEQSYDKNYERNWSNKRAADMSTESQSITELADATCDRATSARASYRLESGTALSFDKLTPSNSNTRVKQCRTKNKRKFFSSAEGRAPVKIVNILEGANESQLYAKRSSESNKSSLSQKPESKHNNTLRKTSGRKACVKHNSETPAMYSSHSIDYVERQNSTTMLPTSSKKSRITRFSIAQPEQRTDSEVECSSLDDLGSKCMSEYELELERKGKLWREGTVRQALEVEERESERTRHWQRTTLTGESLERAINYPTSVWNEERKQLNIKRNGGGIFGPF